MNPIQPTIELTTQPKTLLHSIPESVRDTLTARQQAHLETFIARCLQQTKTSKHLTQTYRPVLADNRVSAGFNLLTKELCYPVVGARSLGSRVWDVDNNEYIDLMMGFGINLFGHHPPFIKAALSEQLEKGFQLGPQAESVGEVAQLICELTGVERVAFSNTGTEAVMTAVRLARATTGRNQIVLFTGSYHGHFDGVSAKAEIVDDNFRSVPLYSGITPGSVQNVIVLDYGDWRSLEYIQTHASELAAVLVEPVQSRRPQLQPQDFLQQLRQLTQSTGIALIFDEMITGFRIHPGGAQAWFGIEADIVTYGKVIGGGMPIGVVAGKADYLDRIDGGMWHYGDASAPNVETTLFAGTYCKHPLAIAAAKAVLSYLKIEGMTLCQQLNQRTASFVETLNTCFESANVPLRMAYFGSLFSPIVSPNPSEQPVSHNRSSISIATLLLYYHLLSRRIILFRDGSGFLSTAHTDDDLRFVTQAVQDSINELREHEFL
jgi:glutamate-1-semialdehyde 2,1-aminomutase